MIWATLVFVGLAIITWRIAHTSFNGLAHWLNAGSDNTEVTQESEIGKLIATADRYFAERKWLAAEKAYLKVLKADHKNMAAFRRLGMTYSYLHNYIDAADCIEFVIKHDPTAVDFQNLATVLHHQDKLSPAIEAMRRSLETGRRLVRFGALRPAECTSRAAPRGSRYRRHPRWHTSAIRPAGPDRGACRSQGASRPARAGSIAPPIRPRSSWAG